MKRASSTLACLTLTLTAGGVFAAPHAAAVGDCNTWMTDKAPYGGSAYCSGMAWGDEFRVKLTCISPHGTQFIVYGPWKKNAKTSSAICSTNPSVGVYKVGWGFKGHS